MIKIIVISLLLPICLLAQSKKEIKKNGVKTLTESISEGNKSHKSLYQKFNKKGSLIEEIDFDNTGKIKSTKTFKYNQKNDKIEELTLDANNKQTERQSFKYD